MIAIGPGGFDLAKKLRASRRDMVPIVFAAVDEKTATGELPPDATGIAMVWTPSGMIKVAKAIVPGLKRIALVGDRFEQSLYYRNFADELRAYSSDFEFMNLMGQPLSQVRRRVAALSDDSVIFYFPISSDDQGTTFASAVEAFPFVASVANRPIIVDTSGYIGLGAVGGFVLTAEQVGQDAGRLALRILNGESASDIPIETANKLKPIFDWRQLQRWGISEAELPEGSEIRFRAPTAWDQYRIEILTIVAVLLLQSALIIWLTYEHRRRHAAEVLARNSMFELTRVNRMATAGELSASIAHEVSQPLTSILARASAALNWLRADSPDLSKVRASLEQIVSSSHRAGDVVQSIRTIFRKDSNERVPVDLNRLIQSVLEILRIDLQKNKVELQTQLDEKLPLVEGDNTQLQQVLLNLIMNAIEAMQLARRRVLRVSSEQSKPGMVKVSIEDNGAGIDPSDLDHIFEPLFTTKTQGMGMGLAICRSIIESHGGRIWVSKGFNRGSVFRFELPVYRHDQSVPQLPPSAAPKVAPHVDA